MYRYKSRKNREMIFMVITVFYPGYKKRKQKKNKCQKQYFLVSFVFFIFFFGFCAQDKNGVLRYILRSKINNGLISKNDAFLKGKIHFLITDFLIEAILIEAIRLIEQKKNILYTNYRDELLRIQRPTFSNTFNNFSNVRPKKKLNS